MVKSAQQLLDEFKREYEEEGRLAAQETDLRHLTAEIHMALSELRSGETQRLRKGLSRILLRDENELRLINSELAYHNEALSEVTAGVRIPFHKIGIRIKEECIEILRLDEKAIKELGRNPSKRDLASALSKMERLAVVEFKQAEVLREKLERDIRKRGSIRKDPIETTTVGEIPYKLKDPKVIEMIRLDQEAAEQGIPLLVEYAKTHPGVPLVRNGRYNAEVAALFKNSISLKAIELGYKLARSPEFIRHPDDGGFDYPDKFAFFWFFQHSANAETMTKGIMAYATFIKYLEEDTNPRITPDIRHMLIGSFVTAINSTRRYLRFQTDPKYQRIPLEFNPRWITGDWAKLETLIVEGRRIPTFKP